MPLIAAISFWSVLGPTARAEEDDTAALAAALKTAKATLQDGLRASKARGTPISAKFEIEDGKLQLSIYTMKGNDFIEVVADPKAGAIAYAQEITDAMDLNEAIEGRRGQGESAPARSRRYSGERECRVPSGQHRS